ncbi:putative transcription factor MYB-HB-like family [Helianthus anomalus]
MCIPITLSAIHATDLITIVYTKIMASSSEMNTGELKKGLWSHEEDQLLISYINRYGIWNWSQMPRFAGKDKKPLYIY